MILQNKIKSPRETSQWERAECCSWMYNEVTETNPVSNVWDGNLWQRAIFSKRKQTFHPINGLIGQMHQPYTDVISETMCSCRYYESGDGGKRRRRTKTAPVLSKHSPANLFFSLLKHHPDVCTSDSGSSCGMASSGTQEKSSGRCSNV